MASPSTITCIAREAGLSHATVSVVLNERGDAVGIRPETQRRVREIAKRLDYVRNPLAAGLKGARMQTIGVLWSLGGPHDSEGMIRRIASRMQNKGYLTHPSDHLVQIKDTVRILSDLSRRCVDAVILQDGDADQLHTPEILELLGRFPAAVIVSTHEWNAPCDLIVHDRLIAFREVADHFAAIGRRRPAIMLPLAGSRDKVNAFLNQARLHGMEVTSSSAIDILTESKQKLSARYFDALEQQFRGSFPFDCLICSTDEGAAAALSWLRRRGLKVPEDVALVGFNDSLVADYLDPPLASIHRHDDKVADALEKIVLERLNHSDAPLARQRIAMCFVWRESAGIGIKE